LAHKKPIIRIILFVVLITACATWIWVSRVPESVRGDQDSAAAQTGFLAPDFTLTTLEGENFNLGAQRGNPVILNLWASWCPPCRAEMAALQQVYQEFQPEGLVVAAVNASNQDSVSEAAAFVSQNGLTFPVPLDRSGSVSRLYNLTSLPTTYFIDRSGVIQNIVIGGPMPLSLIRIETTRLLQE
jgi:peroxiredoxin